VSRSPDDPHSEVRRQILRRAALYSAGFIGAALVIAMVGAAFIAWLLTWRGQPFMRTWLIAMAIIVLPGLAAAIWKTIRGR
jgi:hypothetical protein